MLGRLLDHGTTVCWRSASRWAVNRPWCVATGGWLLCFTGCWNRFH